MKKAFAVLVLFAVLFSGFAALTPGVHAVETRAITNDRIGTYTLFSHDFTQDAQVPENVVLDLTDQTNKPLLSLDHGLKVSYSNTVTANNLQIIGICPAPVYTIELTLGYNPDTSSTGLYFEIPRMGIVSAGHREMFELSTTATTPKKLRLDIINANPSTLYETMPPIENDSGYLKIGIRAYLNGYNHTLGIQLFNTTNETAIAWANMVTPSGIYPYAGMGTFIRFFPYTAGKTLNFKIYSIKQYVDRYTITALPPTKILAYDLNWAEEEYSTSWILNELKNISSSYHASWAPQPSNPNRVQYFSTDTQMYSYFKNATDNYDWEPGLLVYDQLTLDSWANATENITNDYNAIKNGVGYAPKTWDVRAYYVNESLAEYAWTNYQMINREVGFTIPFWWSEWQYSHGWQDASGNDIQGLKRLVDSGVPFAVFSDEAKKDHDTSFDANESIYRSTFTDFFNYAKQHGYQVVGWYEYYEILMNAHDATFTNIEKGDGYLKFTAHTNGYKAWVDVDFPHSSTVQVYDETAKKYIDWKPGSVQFWVEDGHTYILKELISYNIGISFDWTYAMIGIMVPLVVFAALIQFFGGFVQNIKKFAKLGGRK